MRVWHVLANLKLKCHRPSPSREPQIALSVRSNTQAAPQVSVKRGAAQKESSVRQAAVMGCGRVLVGCQGRWMDGWRWI